MIGNLFEFNGTDTSLKTDKWRNHAGGLSIAFRLIRREQLRVDAYVTVMNCTLFDNTSDPGLADTRITTNVLTTIILKGGGAVINTNSNTEVSVLVRNCIFQKHYASAFGGGLFVAFGVVANYTVVIYYS